MKLTIQYNIYMCVYVYGNCTGVACIHVCALKYACVCVFVCRYVIVCSVHMHVHTYILLGTGVYRSVHTICASMRVYVFMCVCTHVRTYVTYMVWFAWQLAMQVTTQNDALQW